MCLTIPRKIVEIEEDKAIVDYGSEKREAKIVEGDFGVG
ncbi:MAG: HypC/HybG/HupF family hydrogenase formation chaperone [Nanoarchaeota archaeon]|nr:HypC/HybG/HupF family hydrogenase formation chaperone [Nanoarchaeota archaeon]